MGRDITQEVVDLGKRGKSIANFHANKKEKTAYVEFKPHKYETG